MATLGGVPFQVKASVQRQPLNPQQVPKLKNLPSSLGGVSFQVKASVQRRPINPQQVPKLRTLLSSIFMPLLTELEKKTMRIEICEGIKNASLKMLDVFVDSVFQFVDQPILPSQENFAPVEEIGEIVEAVCFEGEIPADFPQGVYMRNGANPLFGAHKSTSSVLGRTNEIWVEGDGMLHALYFNKDSNGNWSFEYNNKFVESDTFKLEKQRNKPLFLPGVEGDSLAILVAPLLNMLRFGLATKIMSNTNVFEHAGKYYSITENYLAQEIDISTLETLGNWDLDGAWGRAFTSHPKKDPLTGEMVIMGVEPVKPYYVVGVISADGKLKHKVDINLERSTLPHEIGITKKYNIILDYPLTLSVDRLYQGGQFIKFVKEEYARIGVMPRYGDADSIKWFNIETHCIFHIFNCFEDGDDEVVMRGCKANAAIIPGPDWGVDKFEWFSRAFKQPVQNSSCQNEENMGDFMNDSTGDGLLFTCAHEWRLNMKTGEVKEKVLSGNEFSMDFPFINGDFTGLKHKYGYTQVLDSIASSTCGKTKYGSLAKLHFEEPKSMSSLRGELMEKQLVKVEYHKLGKSNFCTGSAFVSKQGAIEEDDGWIVAFVHDEDTDISHVLVVDAKKFEEEAVAKIAIPQRVPYGHHGAYFATPTQQ